MFFFIREGKYVTASTKFFYWIAVVAGIIGAVGSFIMLKKGWIIFIGLILALLNLGYVVFSWRFLNKGNRSDAITACGYAVACAIIPFILQAVDFEYADYVSLSAPSLAPLAANLMGLFGSKKLSQKWDENLKVCASMKGPHSRIPVTVLYSLASIGVVLSVIALLSGSLPK